MTSPDVDNGSAEWTTRVLCPDDSCLGVLGADGRCPCCGKVGSLPDPAALHAEPPALVVDETAAPAPSATASDSSAGDEEFASRQLCPDDSCIGVLGEGGVCKVCGARPQ